MSETRITDIDWPADLTLDNLGEAIGAMHGLTVILEPIPEHMRTPEVTGLTFTEGDRAHVYYDPIDLSPLNQIQAVMHEFAHILHGDVRADPEEASTHHRTDFDDQIEARAERTGMALMAEYHRRRWRHHSDVLNFLEGTP